jgi:ankyrin repeat protein
VRHFWKATNRPPPLRTEHWKLAKKALFTAITGYLGEAMEALRARLAALEGGEVENGPRATSRSQQSQQPLERPVGRTLHDAAADGDAEHVLALLGAGADPDSRQYGLARIGRTALHAAAMQPRAELVHTMLQSAAAACNELAVDRLGRSTLHMAAIHGHAEVAQALVARTPELLHGTTESGATPLHEACYHGHERVVDVLCRAHADINACDTVGRLPLHWASERGHAPSCAMLLSHALHMKHSLDPVNAVDQLQRSSLHLACLHGHPDVAAVLVAHGADVNAVDSIGQTPMELAGMNHEAARDQTRGDGSQAQNAVLGIDVTEPSRTGRLHERPIVAPPRGRTPLNVGRQRTDVTHDPTHAREEHPDTIAARGHLGCVTLLLNAGARAPGGSE